SWRRIETGVEVALSSGARLNDGSLLLASQSGELLISRDQGRSFRHVPDSAGATLAGLVVAPDGSLTRVGLSGLSRQTLDFSAVQR
ncbi:glycosyl hydrolase, partial [Pseudomonas sp. CrR25]|nr:glycosyl hydrolase [Pseudomonas sp. CrR25]